MSQESQSREAIELNLDVITNIQAEREGIEPPVKQEEKVEEPVVEENQELELEVADTEQADALKAEAKELGLDENATKEQIDVAKTEKLKTEAKELGLPETATQEEINAKKEELSKPPVTLELSLDDVEGFKKEPEEGSWLHVAKVEGLEVKEDSWDAVKEALVSPYVKQIEDIKTMTVEKLFENLKPETVANLKLLESGIPEDELFEPTRKIDGYLSMDNAALVRADKVAMGWKDDMVDREMEKLTADGLIDHEAQKLRLMLNDAKASIIQERKTYIEQYESKKEQALLAKEEQSRVQFKQAMNKISTFMEAPISPEIKEAIAVKYNKGAYKGILSSSEAEAEYVLYKEFHKKITAALKNTASSKGKEEIVKKLLNVPPETNTNTGSNQKPTTLTSNDDPWAAVVNNAKDRSTT